MAGPGVAGRAHTPQASRRDGAGVRARARALRFRGAQVSAGHAGVHLSYTPRLCARREPGVLRAHRHGSALKRLLPNQRFLLSP